MYRMGPRIHDVCIQGRPSLEWPPVYNDVCIWGPIPSMDVPHIHTTLGFRGVKGLQ